MPPETEGTTEAIVLVKAAPQVSQKNRETVCCAGVTLDGKWVRLYPVSFRTLDDAQKFGRWDRIRFKWRKPTTDTRPESLRVDQDSIEIVGALPPTERQNFLAPLEVTSLKAMTDAGLSLALLRPRNLQFLVKAKSPEELAEEKKRFVDLHNQSDLFNTKPLIPYEPAPYHFKYQYEIDDGPREGTCQDWEIEATYFPLVKKIRAGAGAGTHETAFRRGVPAAGRGLRNGHTLAPP